MKPLVFIPYMRVLGLPFVTTLRGARAAGFHGVEISLLGMSKKAANDCRHMAQSLKLAVHFHQAWSIDENPTHWFNHLFHWLGRTQPTGYTLAEHLPDDDLPVVVYADRWRETLGHPNWWLQTASCFNERLARRITYDDFLKVVRRHSLPVVFDTQHYLEMSLGVSGVEGFPESISVLRDRLIRGWRELGPLVKEIHLCDSDPALGHSASRNVFLGCGRLPLRDFCRFVKESGWEGVVTPEVSPAHILGRRRRLEEIRRLALQYFD